MKICFIGGGNMARALIGGMLNKGFAAEDIMAVDRAEACRERLSADFGIAVVEAVDASVFACDVLVLAVKPQQMKEALEPLAGKLASPLVISVAAGLRLDTLSRWLGGYRRLVRCMPNTPALIGAGVTGMLADVSVGPDELIAAEMILASVGEVLWVESEEQIDAVTAISGSGPAYVFHFIEALEAAAREQGFDAHTARQLALGTTLGAARLAVQSSDSPEALRVQVTSKGGTTEAALVSLADAGWEGALIRATLAAAHRAKELGDALDQD